MLNDIMVSMVCPPDRRGFWGGMMRFSQNLVTCFAPLVLSLWAQPSGVPFVSIFTSHQVCSLLSSCSAFLTPHRAFLTVRVSPPPPPPPLSSLLHLLPSSPLPRIQAMGTFCGIVSILAGCLYLPLLSVYRPPDPAPPKELTDAELEKYVRASLRFSSPLIASHSLHSQSSLTVFSHSLLSPSPSPSHLHPHSQVRRRFGGGVEEVHRQAPLTYQREARRKGPRAVRGASSPTTAPHTLNRHPRATATNNLIHHHHTTTAQSQVYAHVGQI